MILDQYGKPIQAQRAIPKRDAAPDGQRWTLRRWAVAQTDRLNEAHWENAAGNPINTDLASDLETICARAAYEAYNNPLLSGVIDTYKTELVGPHGPELQCQSSDDRYNVAFESLWREWFQRADYCGRLDGTELLRQWVGMWWLRGEFLATLKSRSDDFPISLRVQNLHPMQLATPTSQIINPNVVMGVEIDDEGTPVRYWINRVDRSGAFEWTREPEPYPIDLVIHDFDQAEPGQVRGFPWLAACLQTAADLRDYDDQVLDAARTAADLSVLLANEHPDAPYLPLNESTDIQRRTISNLPPAWKPFVVTPGQPSAQYVDYRAERMIDIGRPANMPLMMVRLSSEKHNYSSARFDNQLFVRGIAARRNRITRTLNRLAREVQQEARLEARSGRRRLDGVLSSPPPDATFHFLWQPSPHVDPNKEAQAQSLRLLNLTTTIADELAVEGRSWKPHLERLAREFGELTDKGLLPLLLASRLANVSTREAMTGEPDEEPTQVDQRGKTAAPNGGQTGKRTSQASKA